MTEFSYTKSLSLNDYRKTYFLRTIRKPGIIIAMTVGLIELTLAFIDLRSDKSFFQDPPYSELILGSFLLLSPFILTGAAYLIVKTNKNLTQPVKYSFSDTGYTTETSTSNSNFNWEHIQKIKETREYLILYHTTSAGHFIEKSRLTADQIDFIKSKVTR